MWGRTNTQLSRKMATMDETPTGHRRLPWYQEPAAQERILRFFEPEEWQTVVEEAEALEKRAHLQIYEEKQEELGKVFLAIGKQEKDGNNIPDDLYNELNRLYYIIRIHYTLMEHTDKAKDSFDQMCEAVQKVRQQYQESGQATDLAGAAAAATGATGAIPKTGTWAWFLTPKVIKMVESAYGADEWTELVETAEAENIETRKQKFQGHCHEFAGRFNNEWVALIEANEAIGEDSLKEGQRDYHAAQLYKSLIGEGGDTATTYKEVVDGMQMAEVHNLKLSDAERERDAASARRQESPLKPAKLVAGRGSNDANDSVPTEAEQIGIMTQNIDRIGKKYSNHWGFTEEKERNEQARTVNFDKKAWSVFEEIRQLTMDDDFEPTQPLTELLVSHTRDRGLLEHERQAMAAILTQFTHKRVDALRRLLVVHQQQQRSPLTGAVLKLVGEIDDDFGSFTLVTPRRTPSEEFAVFGAEGLMLSEETMAPTRAQPKPEIRAQGLSAFHQYAVPQPLQHLRRAQMVGPPYNRFMGPSNLSQPLARAVQPQAALQDSPLAKLISTPRPIRGVRPSPFFPDPATPIPGMVPPTGPPPTATNPFEDIVRGPPKRRTTVGTPEAPAGATGRLTTPGASMAAATGMATAAAMGAATATAATSGLAAAETKDAAILQFLAQLTDKITADSASRSTTRIKFPDFKSGTFSGDETKFLPWLIDWTEMLRLDPGLPDHAKVILLKQHLSPDVKEQLRFTSSDTLGYEECMQILLNKYARTHQVQRAYRRKIQELTAPTSNNDYKGLDRMIMETKKTMNALELLGQSTMEIGCMVKDNLMDKLPSNMYAEFLRFAYHSTGRDPKALDVTHLLTVLETFAQLQEDVQNHKPEKSTNSTGRTGGRGQNERNNRREENRTEMRQTTMATTGGNSTVEPYCALCQARDHWAQNCSRYRTPRERRNRFNERKLCYVCARTHIGMAKECQARWNCGAKLKDSRCTERHHIALHDYYAAAGPRQGGSDGNRGRSPSINRDRSQSRDGRGTPSNGRNRSQSNERGRVRFVDEKDKREGNRSGSGNGRRRE